MVEPSNPARDHVCLIGMMGAGKTTVGAILGERLGRPLIDTDEQICAAQGRSVAEIFDTDGEAAFRALEAQAVRAALASEVASVVSVGGGAVLDPSTRWLLGRGGPVVWLRADPETLAVRLGGAAGRPLLSHAGPDGDPLESLRQIDRARRQVYAGLADVTVSVDHLEPHRVADEVLAALGVRGRPQ